MSWLPPRYELQAELPALDFMVTDNMFVGGNDHDGHSAYPLHGDAVSATFRTAADELNGLGDAAQRFADAGWQVDVKDGIITVTAPAGLATEELISAARAAAGAYEDAFTWNLPLSISGRELNELDTMPGNA